MPRKKSALYRSDDDRASDAPSFTSSATDQILTLDELEKLQGQDSIKGDDEAGTDPTVEGGRHNIYTGWSKENGMAYFCYSDAKTSHNK